MNICFNSLSNCSASFLKESILPSLTSLQKKIIVIASIAFGLLAALYLANRCCFGGTEKKTYADVSVGEFVLILFLVTLCFSSK